MVPDNYNVIEFDYGCRPSSGPTPDTDRCGVYANDEDCEYDEANVESDEDVDDESNGDLDVQADGHVSSFRTFNQVVENEQGIYVSAHVASCDVSNNPNDEEPNESSPVHYHLPPSPQFEHVQNFGNAISSDWTPWVQHTTRYSNGEFVDGQVFNSKSNLQEAAKFYSIKAHQELIILRCKKAEECQCPWKLRAMLVKDTCLFVINKYKGSHTYVNPCLNRDHHQLDSNLVAAHIKGIIKAQFTLSVAAIQVSVMEKWGYEISYKKALDGNYKALRQLFGDFSQSYIEIPHLFLALDQVNPGCVVIWKTFNSNMSNTEIFQRVLWSFKSSIEGFEHYHPVLSIDGTHLNEKYKGTLLIAMGCNGNNQLFPLAFVITEGKNIDSWGWFLACIRNRVTQWTRICVISDRHPGIMAAMSDPHLGWAAVSAYHRICMHQFASNFITHFKDKLLKNLVCRTTLATTQHKFNRHMATIKRINSEAQHWLEAIPFKL